MAQGVDNEQQVQKRNKLSPQVLFFFGTVFTVVRPSAADSLDPFSISDPFHHRHTYRQAHKEKWRLRHHTCTAIPVRAAPGGSAAPYRP